MARKHKKGKISDFPFLTSMDLFYSPSIQFNYYMIQIPKSGMNFHSMSTGIHWNHLMFQNCIHQDSLHLKILLSKRRSIFHSSLQFFLHFFKKYLRIATLICFHIRSPCCFKVRCHHYLRKPGMLHLLYVLIYSSLF